MPECILAPSSPKYFFSSCTIFMGASLTKYFKGIKIILWSSHILDLQVHIGRKSSNFPNAPSLNEKKKRLQRKQWHLKNDWSAINSNWENAIGTLPQGSCADENCRAWQQIVTDEKGEKGLALVQLASLARVLRLRARKKMKGHPRMSTKGGIRRDDEWVRVEETQ